MRKFVFFIVLVLASGIAGAQNLSLKLSELYTTHIVFSTEVTYVDLSNPENVGVKIVKQNRNVVAIKALKPFKESCSVTALQSNGMIHTFIIDYESHPEALVIDMKKIQAEQSRSAVANQPVGSLEDGARKRKGRAAEEEHFEAEASGDVTAVIAGADGSIPPTFESVLSQKRGIHHISDTQYGVSVCCYNIFVYRDLTYLVLMIENKSNISYATGDPQFEVENRKKAKREVEYSNKVTPRSSYGSLNCEPEQRSLIVYCFNKITLNKGQQLKACVYEQEGQRNLQIVFSASDFNEAVKIEG